MKPQVMGVARVQARNLRRARVRDESARISRSVFAKCCSRAVVTPSSTAGSSEP